MNYHYGRSFTFDTLMGTPQCCAYEYNSRRIPSRSLLEYVKAQNAALQTIKLTILQATGRPRGTTSSARYVHCRGLEIQTSWTRSTSETIETPKKKYLKRKQANVNGFFSSRLILNRSGDEPLIFRIAA